MLAPALISITKPDWKGMSGGKSSSLFGPLLNSKEEGCITLVPGSIQINLMIQFLIQLLHPILGQPVEKVHLLTKVHLPGVIVIKLFSL
jgi:hypothetical protein